MELGLILPIVVVVVLVGVLAFALWLSRGALVALGQRVDEGWADIRAQLQRRADLVPPLVEAVASYAPHDRAVYDAVGRAREETLAADEPLAASAAENHMQQSLKAVVGVADSYPQLLASTRFLELQTALVDSEDRLQASRRFYNGAVREYNARIRVLPNSLFARRLGFARREFFEGAGSAAIAQPPRVQF